MKFKFVVSQKEAKYLKSMNAWNEELYILNEKIAVNKIGKEKQ